MKFIVHEERVGEVLRELAARGFTPRTSLGVRSFEGDIDCRGEVVRVRLYLADWDFIDYPPIEVLSGVDPTALLPHIDTRRRLCYFQRGSVVLDRYRPAAAVALCIEQVQRVLVRIKFDPHYRRNDVQDEFLAHWLDGQALRIFPVLLGTVATASKSTNYWQIDVGGTKQFLLADGEGEAAVIARALGAEPAKYTSCPCWIFKSELPPAVPQRMPATVKELFQWLKAWDPSVYRALHRVLDTEVLYLKFAFATFAVKTPIGWLGFGFDLDPLVCAGALQRPNPQVYRQHLHGRGSNGQILRLSIIEIGPDFVHSRNLTFADLKSKQIKLVGCGAIGSYIAQALVRLGAGAGDGCLTLIDPDTLGPENLGRHVLGYPALFQPKANALRDELLRQFPMAKIEAFTTDVRDVKALLNAHLVIDATGEEAVSEMLNARRLERASTTPVLHVWILGNGEAVQTLWTQERKTGCYRCLRKLDSDGRREERYPVLTQAPTRRQLGCRAFTPYAVSAPMHAASLAIEVIVDWLQRGDPKPRFRTRAADNADVRKTKDQDPTPLAGCPACGCRDVA